MRHSLFSSLGDGGAEGPTGTAQLDTGFLKPQGAADGNRSCAARDHKSTIARFPVPQPDYIEFTRAEVVRRARQLWTDAGRPDGPHCRFWLDAQLEIMAVALATLRKLKAVARPPRLRVASRQRHAHPKRDFGQRSIRNPAETPTPLIV